MAGRVVLASILALLALAGPAAAQDIRDESARLVEVTDSELARLRAEGFQIGKTVADESAMTAQVAERNSAARGERRANSFAAGGPGSAFAPLASTPLALLTYAGPTSNDPVTINVKQSIGANDPLRTDSYSKTLTFTLSTNNP